MSWTTHWTSHLIHEPAEFGVLALGRIAGEPKAFGVPQWDGPPRPAPRGDVSLLRPAGRDAAAQRTLPVLSGRNLWCIHPPGEAFKGFEKSRLAPFASAFGWRLRRSVTEYLDLDMAAGKEWKWWFHGFDQEKMGNEVWSLGVSEDKLARSVFTLEWRRYASGDCLPPYRTAPAIAGKGFEQLRERFGNRLCSLRLLTYHSG